MKVLPLPTASVAQQRPLLWCTSLVNQLYLPLRPLQHHGLKVPRDWSTASIQITVRIAAIHPTLLLKTLFPSTVVSKIPNLSTAKELVLVQTHCALVLWTTFWRIILMTPSMMT